MKEFGINTLGILVAHMKLKLKVRPSLFVDFVVRQQNEIYF